MFTCKDTHNQSSGLSATVNKLYTPVSFLIAHGGENYKEGLIWNSMKS